MRPLPGFLNIDGTIAPGVDKILDLNRVGCLAVFDDATATEIVAHSVLEHLPNWEFLFVEMSRVAAEGCVLSIEVPNRWDYRPYHVRAFNRRSFDMFCSNIYVRDDGFRRTRISDSTVRGAYFTLQELGFYWFKRDVHRNHWFPFLYHIRKHLGERVFRFFEGHVGKRRNLCFTLIRNGIPYRREG
jgi:SAM-dependent methyltransferase